MISPILELVDLALHMHILFGKEAEIYRHAHACRQSFLPML